MHQIKIAMHTSLHKGKMTYQVELPQEWDELQPEKAWACMAILLQSKPRRLLIKELLDIPYKVYQRIGTGEMYDLLQCVQWMQINTASTKPIAPWVTAGDTKLYLPGESFTNVTAREYLILDELYPQFLESDDPDVEASMLAIALRPEGGSLDRGDLRVPLQTRTQTEQWKSLVKQLPETTKAYVALLIGANRKMIYDLYSHWLFEEPKKEQSEDDAPQPPDDSDGFDLGLTGLFMDIAEDGAFGHFEQVLDSNIHNLFAFQAKKVDALRREKQAMDAELAASRSRR